jgi:fructoselysine and glucoselysine-specific PTS system IIB component
MKKRPDYYQGKAESTGFIWLTHREADNKLSSTIFQRNSSVHPPNMDGGEILVKLLRVDHRLMHGQIGFAWVHGLDADCILIANDTTATDELAKTATKLAKPQGIKMVIKTIAESIKALNDGVTDQYKLFIIVGSIEDAKLLADAYPGITHINLGGTPPRQGARKIARVIYVLPEEVEMLNELVERGIEVEIRLLPKYKKVYFKDVENKDIAL